MAIDYGEQLVRQAILDAKEVGAKQVTLVTLLERMESAWRLYEKLGFVREREELCYQSPRRMTVLYYKLDL